MARSVNKSHGAFFVRHLVGSNVLGDSTGLSFGEDYDEDDKLQTRLFSVGRTCWMRNI